MNGAKRNGTLDTQIHRAEKFTTSLEYYLFYSLTYNKTIEKHLIYIYLIALSPVVLLYTLRNFNYVCDLTLIDSAYLYSNRLGQCIC